MTIQVYLHILELDNAQDLDQLHRAYRRQVKRWHPDQFAHQPAIHAQAEERLKRINHAYSILKEHLHKKTSCHSHTPTTKDTKTENRQDSNEPKFSRSFRWSQWFKQTHRQRRQNNKKAGSQKSKHLSGTASNAQKETSFKHILRQAADNPIRSAARKRTGVRPYFHIHLRKQGKRGTRIEGFKPVSPITPVRPVSKINGIEGSE